jgi:glycosyltransferase involved in cell wall biosynthesis
MEKHITMLGMRTDVRALLSASDAFLLSSLSEGIPVTILEAMASGVPVAATNVGGVSEILDDSVTGLLAPPADARRLADALLRLVQEPKLASSIAAAAKEVVHSRFSEPSMIAAYDQVYREVADTPANRSRKRQRQQVARPVAAKT